MQLLKREPISTEVLASFKTHPIDLAHSYCRSTIDKSDFYQHQDHLKVVKSLRNYNSIIITRSDQGGGVVILSKHNYVNKKADILDDTTKFEILDRVEECHKSAIQEQHIQP